MFFVMAAQRRVDEQAHPLCRYWLVEETVHGARSDLCGEHRLVFGAAGDDQHKVRKLLPQARRQLLERTRHCGRVDQGHAALAADDELGELRLAQADTDRVVRGDHFLHRVDDAIVLR